MSLELARFDGFENLAKLWTWLQTEGHQIVSSHEWWRNDRFVGEFLAFPEKKFVIVEHSMTALAIDPVQLKLVVKSGSRHKTLQFCHPHLRHVLKHHVLPDHFDRVLNLSAGKSQTAHDFFSNLRSQAIMPAEANSPGFIHRGGARFCHVVKQHRENERHRNFLRQKVQH